MMCIRGLHRGVFIPIGGYCHNSLLYKGSKDDEGLELEVTG